jgi:DNA-binding XRE family transcriptional regulator
MKKTTQKKLFDLSVKIKVIRRARQLSEAELAFLINKDAETITKLESGNYDPPVSLLFSIADAFGIEMKDLVD